MASVDIYTMVTDRIISELEKGLIPWHKPWIGSSGAVSHVTGKPYSLLNQILLGKPGEWLTFAQAVKEGGSVRKGEKSRFVVFWKFIEKIEYVDGEANITRIPMLRYFNVFHIDQCEGIKPRINKPVSDFDPEETAQKLFDDYIEREGITLTHEEGSSYYRPSADTINLPEMNRFFNRAEYYSTAFHESIHSTGSEKRLNRLAKTAFFGSEEYSKEELVAELGAAMLVSHAGIETKDSFKNSTAYIQNWLTALRNDKHMVVSAAGKAEKAVKFFLNEEVEEEPA